jgi:hypothetical protein
MHQQGFRTKGSRKLLPFVRPATLSPSTAAPFEVQFWGVLNPILSFTTYYCAYPDFVWTQAVSPLGELV